LTNKSQRIWWHICIFATAHSQTKKAKEPPSQRTKTPQTMDNRATTDRTQAPNSTYPKGGVLCSIDSLVVNQSLVLRINTVSYRDGENRHLHQARKRKQFILVSML
jgi:hypothetical protein